MNLLLIDTNITHHELLVKCCNNKTIPFLYDKSTQYDSIVKLVKDYKITRVGIMFTNNMNDLKSFIQIGEDVSNNTLKEVLSKIKNI